MCGASGWLATANYAGYLLGALTASRLPARDTTALRAALVIIVATTALSDGVLDPALDAQANVANTVSWTIDLATCFDWSLMASGTAFDLDIQAVSVYGDNAARKLFFKKG